MENFIWKIKTFDELSATEFHAILKARIDVFIVEQNCPYPEVDGYDPKAVHLWAEYNDDVAAYCRIFQRGIKYEECSIGRVLTTENYRKLNLGKNLMKFAICISETRFLANSIIISAQDYLLKFYSELGFIVTGNRYLEDEIPHSEMIRISYEISNDHIDSHSNY